MLIHLLGLFSAVTSTRNREHCSVDLFPFPDLKKKKSLMKIYEVGPSEGAVWQHNEGIQWHGDPCRRWAEGSPSLILVPSWPSSEFRNLHFSLVLERLYFFPCLGRHNAWNIWDVSENCLGLGSLVYGMQGVCGGAKLPLCSRQPPCSCAFPGNAKLLDYIHLVQ